MKLNRRRFSLTPLRYGLFTVAIVAWIETSVSHADSSPQVVGDSNSDVGQAVSSSDTLTVEHSHNDVKGLPEPAPQQGTVSSLNAKKHRHAELKGNTKAETIAEEGRSTIEKVHDHQKMKGVQR